MKCQSLFSWKNNKKYFKMLSAGFFTQSVLSINVFPYLVDILLPFFPVILKNLSTQYGY